MATSIARNVAVTMLKKLTSGFRVKRLDEESTARTWAETLQLKFASLSDPVERLSGGNQQKIVLAREIERNPDLLLIGQPTRGVDIGAAEYIHSRLIDQRGEGTAAVVISEDLDELLGLADRIAVMFEGRIMAIIDIADATREGLGLLMAGVDATADA